MQTITRVRLSLGVATLLAVLFATGAPAYAAKRGMAASPSSLDFGSLAVGSTSAPMNVVLTNSSKSKVAIQSISLSAAQFSYAGAAPLPITLNPGQSWTGAVVFLPDAAQTFNGTMALRLSSRSTVTVQLSGTGTANSLGQLTVNPSRIDFGDQPVGTSSSQTIAVYNSGSSSVAISNVVLSGAGLSVSGIPAGLILAPAQTANLTAAFSPAATGSVTGGITITSNASNAQIAIPLSGTGTAAVVTHSSDVYWNPSISSVIGYNVYCGVVSGGPYAKLTPSPIPTTVYTYGGVQSGQTYYFVATAVDSSGSESPYSNESSIVVP